MTAPAQTCSKWIVRVVVALLLLWPTVRILWFGQDGWWESRLNNDGDLSDREASIARTGVLFEHVTQLCLWGLVLSVHEMAAADDDVSRNHTSRRLRSVTIVTTILWLLYAGVYGMSAFFIDGCQSYGLCLEGGRHYQIRSAMLSIVMVVALVMSACSGGSSRPSSSAAAPLAASRANGAAYEPISSATSSANSLKSASADEEKQAGTVSTSSTALLLDDALRQAKSESKDKDKLIAKLGKKLRSLLAENEALRTK